MPADRSSFKIDYERHPRSSYKEWLKQHPDYKAPPRRRPPPKNAPPPLLSPEELEQSLSHFTPEFRARWIAACARMKQAMDGTLPPDAPPVYYSKVYSYLHPQAAIPENTPYEDAPLVIDWMLDANFPQTPPIAHFLSWTNGNGRGACDVSARGRRSMC